MEFPTVSQPLSDDEFFSEFNLCIDQALRDLQVLPTIDVPRVASALRVAVQRQLGGRIVYVRTGAGKDREDRDSQIRAAAAAGRAREEICREFGVSRAQFYRITKPPSLTA